MSETLPSFKKHPTKGASNLQKVDSQLLESTKDKGLLEPTAYFRQVTLFFRSIFTDSVF